MERSLGHEIEVIMTDFNLNLFDYECAWQALNFRWSERKELNKHLSLRVLARKIGVASAGNLSRFFRGLHNISLHNFRELCMTLHFSEREIIFLELTYQRDIESNPKDKEKIISTIDELKSRIWYEFQVKMNAHRFQNLSYLMLLLMDLVYIEGFSPDPQWIKNKLWMPHSTEEIQSAWKQLIEKDILYHDGTRFRRRGFLEINGTEAMKLSASIMNFISENYLQVSKENRFFLTSTWSIPSSKLPELRIKMTEFYDSINTWCSQQNESIDCITEICFAMAKMTKD
jgi:hypothetical protein